MEDKFDCIIVGGGVAGLSAAMTLARADARFLLIERGEFCGAKNVSGGVLWGSDLFRLVPDYADDPDSFERFVNHRRLTFMDEESAFSVDFKSTHFENTPYAGVSVLRARFDAWLSGQVEAVIEQGANAESSFLATNILVEDVLVEDERVVGIRAGGDAFYADCVILAEGVNNLLTRKVGIEPAYVSADHVAVGIKEIIEFEEGILEDRFQLRGRSGLTNEFVGYCSDGVEGGGFLYTNKSSISLGLVLGMKDLREKKKSPQDILSHFKEHPVIRDMIRGGKVTEYSAHVVSTGNVDAVPERLYGDGVLISGEAAHLLLNAGKAIQGMDYAMRSGILAAETVLAAGKREDFSASSLADYQTALDGSYVMIDMREFQDAVKLLHHPSMFGPLPNVVCDFGRQYFSIKSEPTPKARHMLRAAVKRHSSYWDLIKLGAKAAKAL